MTDLGLPFRDMIDRHTRGGGHFFERGTMRFFSSRILRGQYPGADGFYFVTSEQFDYQSPRLYTVRRMSPDFARIDTVGGFQTYRDARSARRAAKLASYASQGIH